MVQIVLVGTIAGLASALMVASLASGAPIALALYNFAPLPILVAALGWTHIAGVVASAVAAILLAAIFGHVLFFTFLAGIALPAWWTAYLVMLGRPDGSPDGLEWYPIGRLTLWIALFSSLSVMLMVFVVADDVDTLRAALRQIVLAYRDKGDADFVAGMPTWLMQTMIDYPDRILLPVSAALTMLMQILMLWLAARIVMVSGRLRRPWPVLAEVALPPTTFVVLALSILLALMPDTVGAAASAIAACLITAYALVGLAIIHALTRALRGRGAMLGALYGAIVILGWPFLVMPLIGLADSVLDLRHRGNRGPPIVPH